MVKKCLHSCEPSTREERSSSLQAVCRAQWKDAGCKRRGGRGLGGEGKECVSSPKRRPGAHHEDEILPAQIWEATIEGQNEWAIIASLPPTAWSLLCLVLLQNCLPSGQGDCGTGGYYAQAGSGVQWEWVLSQNWIVYWRVWFRSSTSTCVDNAENPDNAVHKRKIKMSYLESVGKRIVYKQKKRRSIYKAA